MRWFVPLVFVVVLILGCSGAAPTATPSPTVDVSATVDAAVEATKLKPRWDVHLSGDDDQLGCAGESLSSVLGERPGSVVCPPPSAHFTLALV